MEEGGDSKEAKEDGEAAGDKAEAEAEEGDQGKDDENSKDEKKKKVKKKSPTKEKPKMEKASSLELPPWFCLSRVPLLHSSSRKPLQSSPPSPPVPKFRTV